MTKVPQFVYGTGEAEEVGSVTQDGPGLRHAPQYKLEPMLVA